MCPTIEISDEIFNRLKNLAEPLVDTPDSVIGRLIDCFERTSDVHEAHETAGVHDVDENDLNVHREYSSIRVIDEVLNFDPTRLPDVTHTTFVNGTVGTRSVGDWNQLSLEVHAAVSEKVGSVEALRRVSTANIKAGAYFERGFKTRAGLNFSLQGVEANKACAISFRLAQEFQIPLTAEFRWQNKDKAAFPDRVGRIEWTPST
jgi:predicted transcriptional regulator